MFLVQIDEVIPEPSIICVSPHYDDFLFFLGGYVLELKNKGLLHTKKFTNINTFSRSNYQEGDVAGNKDRSLARVQKATGVRYVEDLQCLDALLGPHNYTYRVMGEEESLVRGMPLDGGSGAMEMSFGSYETMDDKDWEVLNRMEACINQLAEQSDTAIVLPLSMKGHIDHFIVREAGVRVMNGKNVKASFYFAEDKPYAGIMTEEESAINDEFITKLNLKPRAFNHHAKEVVKLAYDHYPSQVNTVYDEGIYTRSDYLKQHYNVTADCDQIFIRR